MADELRIAVTADVDVVTARQRGREVAAQAGFSSGDQTVIAAAILPWRRKDIYENSPISRFRVAPKLSM